MQRMGPPTKRPDFLTWTVVIATAAITFLFGSIYSIIVTFLAFKYIIFHPVTGSIYSKKRDDRPSCLNDSTLWRHELLQLQDVCLHYVTAGEEGKPLMLLLHGFPEFWYSWRHQIQEFKTDYRVVAVDMRGYGESDKPKGIHNYRIHHLIGDVKQIIQALGYEKCVLVGHDWGGNVAWCFSVNYPEMLNKLVILNCPHPLVMSDYVQSHFSQFKKSWYISFFQIPWIPEFMLQFSDYAGLESLFMGKKKQIANDFTLETMEAYKYAYSREDALTSMINYYRAAVKYPLLVDVKRQIPTKTLVIWGSPDFCLEEEMAPLLAKYVPNLEVEILEDCSHFVQLDKPHAVNRLIRGFLSSKKID